VSKKKQKVLCLDFDGTLCTTGWPEIGTQLLVHKVILNYAKYLQQKKGWWIILYTCREDATYSERKYLKEALIWLQNKGFVPNAWNENYPPAVALYGDCRKVNGDLFIDDKMFSLLGWTLRLVDKLWKKRNVRK